MRPLLAACCELVEDKTKIAKGVTYVFEHKM